MDHVTKGPQGRRVFSKMLKDAFTWRIESLVYSANSLREIGEELRDIVHKYTGWEMQQIEHIPVPTIRSCMSDKARGVWEQRFPKKTFEGESTTVAIARRKEALLCKLIINGEEKHRGIMRDCITLRDTAYPHEECLIIPLQPEEQK